MSTLSRRELLQFMTAVAAVPGVAAPAARTTTTLRARPPEPVVAERVPEQFTPLPFESQRLGGLFAARMQANVNGRLLHIDEAACLAGFVQRDAAGGFDRAWVGEHAGKFLDAACNAVRYREHAGLRQIMARMVQALLSSQEPDGYLGTYPAAHRWTGWDVWVHKYNLIGLLSYYELTADPAVLRACRGMGDLLAHTFGDAPEQRDIIAAGEHIGMAATSVLEPMCRLYRFTGDPRHLQFCQYLVRAYDQPHGPRIVAQLLQGGSVDRVANGKAYEMLSNFNGLVDLYRLTADRRLLDAVLRAWDDMVGWQLYRTGTLSAGEHFQPRGRLLSLPSSNVGETCVTVTWLQLNWRLLRLTAEPRFGQEIERAVYNQLLAAQDGRNGNISYYTSCVGAKEFTDALLCCVSSGPRGISLLPQLAWGLQENALFVNLYTPGRANLQINGVPVEVICETRFPADGRVRLTVKAQRATHFAVRLRVPEWTRDFQVQTSSGMLAGAPGRMLDVAHTWTRSTTLDIRMDLRTQVLPGAPTYPDYELVQRGAQVLALDRALNPTVPYLHRIALADTDDPAAEPRTVPQGRSGRQVYRIDGVIGVPDDADQLRLERRAVYLVPFADTRNGRAWLARSAGARRDRPAVTAFARVGLSVVPLGLGPNAAGYVATDVAEFVTDEDPRTYCTVNPQAPGLANYLGAPPGRRGDPVWFAVMLKNPMTISRVAFRHGVVSATGGWFDTTAALPRIELTQSPIPTSANAAVLDDSKVRWETAGLLELYPRTDASTPPALPDGQLFEVRLPRPLTVYGVRVVGNAGGKYASCAELSAYG